MLEKKRCEEECKNCRFYLGGNDCKLDPLVFAMKIVIMLAVCSAIVGTTLLVIGG